MCERGDLLSDMVKRAWELVFSLKVRANANWYGKKNFKKYCLKDSIITKAVFGKVVNCRVFILIVFIFILHYSWNTVL